MENTNSNINGLLGLAVFILFIGIFYAGAAKKVVIYYDTKDLFIYVVLCPTSMSMVLYFCIVMQRGARFALDYTCCALKPWYCKLKIPL